MNCHRALLHERVLHRVADFEDFVEAAHLKNLADRRRRAAQEKPAAFAVGKLPQIQQRAKPRGTQVFHRAHVDDQFLIRRHQDFSPGSFQFRARSASTRPNTVMMSTSHSLCMRIRNVPEECLPASATLLTTVNSLWNPDASMIWRIKP